MNNSPDITIENLDSLLRHCLLESPENKDVQKVLKIQSENIFKENASIKTLSAAENKLIDRFAGETGYTGKSNWNGLFFILSFSLIAIVLLLVFLSRNNFPILQPSAAQSNHLSFKNDRIISKKENTINNLPLTQKKTSITPTIPAQTKSSNNNHSVSHNNNSNFLSGYMPKLDEQNTSETIKDSLFMNLSFEEIAPNTVQPEVWYAGGSNFNKSYSLVSDSISAYNGKYSMRINRLTHKFSINETGLLTNYLPLKYFKDKNTISVSAYIKTEVVENGNAALWCSEWDGISQGAIKYANSIEQGGNGTSGWKKYSIELSIDTTASQITFGGYLTGKGTAWFDNFEVMIDGVKIKDIKPAVVIPKTEEINWINNNCIPISTFKYNNGFNDLHKLSAIIGDARIVTLAGTMQSSECFQLKHRISEYLVAEKEFSVIAFDASMADVSRINDYIHSAKKDTLYVKDSLLKTLYWYWNTKEIANLIDWAQNVNASGKGKISFYGFNSGNNALEELKAFAIKNDEVLVKKILSFEKKYVKFLEQKADFIKKYKYVILKDTSFLKKINPKFKELEDYMTEKKADYLKIIPEQKFSWYMQLLALTKQSYIMEISNYSKDLYVDYASNIEWIIKQNPDAKIILWTMNENMKNNEFGIGKNLDNKYKSQMKVIGFGSDNGSYTTLKDSIVTAIQLYPSYQGTVEYYLKQCNYPTYILDIQNADSLNSSSKWVYDEKYLRSLQNYDWPKQFSQRKITEWYDIIVFISNINHSENYSMGKKIIK
jgi:erythromycin esterase